MTEFLDSPLSDTVFGIIGIIATLLAFGVGVLLLARGWRLGDPDRNKPHCPRCYTPMAVTADALPARCGNCNREVRREKSLRRPKRNTRAIVGGLALLFFGAMPVIALLARLLPERKGPIFEAGSPAPWFIFGGFFLALGALLIVRGWRFSDAKRWSAHCRKCRYDLRGHKPAGDAATLPVTCPECGRTATRHRHLFKPKKRRLAIAAGIVLFVAGSGLVLTPEVESKGGWSFAARATVFLIALPHLDDPTEWEVYDDFDEAFGKASGAHGAQPRWTGHYMWRWMWWLGRKRCIDAAVDGKTVECRSAAMSMLDGLWRHDLPKHRVASWNNALLSAIQTADASTINKIVSHPVSPPEELVIEELIALIYKNNGTTSTHAAYLLRSTSLENDQRRDLVVDLLRSGDSGLIDLGILLMEEFDLEIEVISDELLRLIDVPGLRYSAMQLLATLGDSAPQRIRDEIASRLASNDPAVQMEGISLVETGGERSSIYLSALVQIALTDSVNAVAAARVTQVVAPPDEVHLVRQELLNAKLPSVRYNAVRAFEQLRLNDPSILADLDRLAGTDPHAEVRSAAQRAADRIRSRNQ